MDTLDSVVRLVVKAPNQKVEDQTIDCALGWTVRKLKDYLAEVYPNKPKSEDQRLIYSGKLLLDDLKLIDILRLHDEDSSNVHTLHLVCAPLRDAAAERSSSHSEPNLPSTSTRSSLPTQVPQSSSQDGLRYRPPQVQPQPTVQLSGLQVPPCRSQPSQQPRFQAQYPAYGSIPAMPPIPGAPITQEQLVQQILWMQQLYTQYTAHYIQAYQMGTFPQPQAVPNAQPSPAVQLNAPANQRLAAQVPPPPQPAAAAQRPANQIRMNAQGGPVDDDDDDDDIVANRDWLDWFYVLSRTAVLFSIVYFYSSFSRFVLVTLIVTILYLYQSGWLQRRRRDRVQPNIAQPVPPAEPVAPPQAAAAPEQANVQNPNPNNGGEIHNDDNNNHNHVNRQEDIVDEQQMMQELREIENLMDQDLDHPMLADRQPPGPSTINIAWTFVKTFFSSLIPENPAPLQAN